MLGRDVLNVLNAALSSVFSTPQPAGLILSSLSWWVLSGLLSVDVPRTNSLCLVELQLDCFGLICLDTFWRTLITTKV